MKWIKLLPLMLLFAACSPTVYRIGVEARQPSKSGMDLAGKTIAVVYDDSVRDSAFNYAFAESFATSLEKDYFNGDRAIGIYSVNFSDGDYSSRDSMVNLVMNTGADVVFLMMNPENGPSSGSDAQASAPITLKMYGYDSLGGEKDNVRFFSGTARVSGDALTQASKLGDQASRTFLSTWKEETYGVYCYNSVNSTWLDATRDAYRFDWDKAIEKWMSLLQTKNIEKKACLEYNIALGCYMLGQKSLALKWLDRSDGDFPLSLSSTLRKKITGK